MAISPDDYLTCDELRLLTHCGSSHLQHEKLLKPGVTFTLDEHGCPMVLYADAKHYFLLLGKPLPRGIPPPA
jgi:hypothetical protein